MCKLSELDEVVKELHDAAKAIINACERLKQLYSDANEAPSKAEAEPTLTLEQVRAVLAEKSRNGHTAEVRVLLEKHGASKLSEIDPTQYSSLLADAEGLRNA